MVSAQWGKNGIGGTMPSDAANVPKQKEPQNY